MFSYKMDILYVDKQFIQKEMMDEWLINHKLNDLTHIVSL